MGYSDRELDYENEAHNQERMRDALCATTGTGAEAGGAGSIYVPKVRCAALSERASERASEVCAALTWRDLFCSVTHHRPLSLSCERLCMAQVHWGASSRKVLCSEWIEGEQLARSSASTIQALVPVGVSAHLPVG
jgi:hypothetical protein